MATTTTSGSTASSTGTIAISNSANTISNAISPSYYTLSDTGSLYWNSYLNSNCNIILKTVIMDENVSETTIRSLFNDFVDKEIDSDVYDTLLKNRKVSERFLNDFFDKLNIVTLLANQKVSYEFIENHIDNIRDSEEACKTLSQFQSLDDVFITEHSDLIVWDSLAGNISIKFTVPFLLKYIDKFSDDGLKALSKNLSITPEVFNVFLDNISDDIRYRLDWRSISWGQQLTEENILNNLDFLDFNSLLLATRKFNSDVITCYRKLKFGI